MSCVHIYCGDGKGKTTASVGLAVRAAGNGKKVFFTQFFKDGSSSELKILKEIGNIELNICPKRHGFYFRMSEEEKKAACADYTELLHQARLAIGRGADLVVLDEAVSACNHGIIDENEVLDLIRNRKDTEIVLTGRNPSEALIGAADYVSEVKKIKHPFDKGIKARKGIEF